MTKEQAFNINLPKWPQMIVNGKSISEAQALEIIKRTDHAFYGEMFGNNRNYVEQAKKILQKPKPEDFKDENNCYDWTAYYAATEVWEKSWGLLPELDYLTNSWVSCCWIGGTHGWCHPDGKIAFNNNIGKWPSVEEVYNEWCIVAKAFPFLNLTCTLANGEEDYADTSLVTMKIKNGEVEFIEPIPFEELTFNGVKFSVLGRSENYFDLAQIQKWYDESFK